MSLKHDLWDVNRATKSGDTCYSSRHPEQHWVLERLWYKNQKIFFMNRESHQYLRSWFIPDLNQWSSLRCMKNFAFSLSLSLCPSHPLYYLLSVLWFFPPSRLRRHHKHYHEKRQEDPIFSDKIPVHLSFSRVHQRLCALFSRSSLECIKTLLISLWFEKFMYLLTGVKGCEGKESTLLSLTTEGRGWGKNIRRKESQENIREIDSPLFSSLFSLSVCLFAASWLLQSFDASSRDSLCREIEERTAWQRMKLIVIQREGK